MIILDYMGVNGNDTNAYPVSNGCYSCVAISMGNVLAMYGE